MILTPFYVGSDRYMWTQYQDLMAIVRALGKPDLFITITCNPKWCEITELLLDATLLMREKLLNVVTNPKPEGANVAWFSKDEKTQALIGLAFEDSQLIHVKPAKRRYRLDEITNIPPADKSSLDLYIKVREDEVVREAIKEAYQRIRDVLVVELKRSAATQEIKKRVEEVIPEGSKVQLRLDRVPHLIRGIDMLATRSHVF